MFYSLTRLPEAAPIEGDSLGPDDERRFTRICLLSHRREAIACYRRFTSSMLKRVGGANERALWRGEQWVVG